MPATCKADLQAVALKEYDKLQALLPQVTADLATQPQEGGVTLKDIVGHRAHWIALFLGWYADGQAGKDVAFPAPGYKWTELNRYNADLRLAQADLTWEDACTMLQGNHARLMALITRLEDDALYGAPMQGAKNHWTTGRWAEAAGPSHYRSAAKFIRQCLRQRDRR